MLLKIKLTSIGLLVAGAAVLTFVRGGSVLPWVLAALAFSWLGDAMLGHLPCVARRVGDPFVAGMALFACAQICYCLAFGQALRAHPSAHTLRIGCVAVGFALVAWFALTHRSGLPMRLKCAVLAYALVLLGMAGLAWSAGLRDGAWPLLAGSLLFVFSDGVIAVHELRGKALPFYEGLVWLSYGPAQLLLLVGAVMLSA